MKKKNLDKNLDKPVSNILGFGLIVLVGLIGFAAVLSIVKTSNTSAVGVSSNPPGQINELVSFVSGAADYIQKNGEASFTALRQQDGQWWQGDKYIFVYDMAGKTLVLPPTPNVEGTSRWDTKDSNGKLYVREMAQQLANQDSAWVQYVYPKPGETNPSPKLAYVKKIKLGNKYVFLGSGVYY